MTRGIDAPTEAALAAPHVTYFLMLELQFATGTQYLASTPHNVDWGGNTYVAAQHIGTIEPTTETDAGVRGLTFTLSAATQASIAGALTEDIQGRPAILRLGIVDSTGTLRVDPNVWSGYLDVMTVNDTPGQPVITVTAENAMLSWQTPSGRLFSHQDQLQVDPTDMFFEYTAELSEATLVWPSKEAFT